LRKKINSRNKGARGEREFAAYLNHFGIDAIRGVQYQGGKDSPDVKTSLDSLVHFEVKRTETLSLYKALEQAANDCGEKKIPVVVHRRNNKKWVAILEARYLLKLLKRKAVK
jgi:Holliday junction resolvase